MQLRHAIEAGIRKINVGTALNIAYTTAVRRLLTAELNHRRSAAVSSPPGRDAIAATVNDLCSAVRPGAAATTAKGTHR